MREQLPDSVAAFATRNKPSTHLRFSILYCLFFSSVCLHSHLLKPIYDRDYFNLESCLFLGVFDQSLFNLVTFLHTIAL